MITGKFHEPAFIQPFSSFWWECIIMVIVILTIIVRAPLHLKKINVKLYGHFIALFFLGNYLFENFYNYSNGYWNFKQWLAECLYYWGLAGGIHSLLTPEFTVGMEGYNFYAYFINHAGLLLVVAFMIIHLKFRPRAKSWIWVFGYTQFVALGVGLVNYSIGANYMYLAHKPEVDNPFVIGEWPYYIIVLEVVALLHFWVFYLPFAQKNKAIAY